MLAVRLMAQIQNRFGQDLPLSVLFQRSTIEELAVIIRRQAAQVNNSPLVSIRPQGEKRPLFGVHPIGGNVLCYVELARHLDPDQPLYGLQSVTLYEDDKQDYSSVQDIAACYLDSIRSVQPQGPYLLAGYSFGGYVAYEIAQQLHMQKQEVEMLALFDCYAPDYQAEPSDYDGATPELDDAALLADFARSEDVPLLLEELQGIDPRERFNYVLEQARKAHKLPPDAGLLLIKRLLKTYKFNKQAMQVYRPNVYAGRVTLFRATDNPQRVNEGWGKLAAGGLEVYDVPGDHHSIFKRPHVQVLAECLNLAMNGQENSHL